MGDNVTTMFGGTRKDASHGQPFYSTRDSEPFRFQIRLKGSYRASFRYISIAELQFLPSITVGPDEVRLVLPDIAVITITGRQLIEVFDAINEQRLDWVRERFDGEEVPGGKLCVESIDYYMLNNPTVDTEHLKRTS